MKQFLSISLALFILASSMGMTFATHHCGEIVMDSAFALGEIDLDCGMGMDDHNNPMTDESIGSDQCCENEYVSIETDDQFNPTFEKSTIHPQFLVALAYTLADFPLLENAQTVAFSDYSPPPLIPDVQVAYQTFLL